MSFDSNLKSFLNALELQFDSHTHVDLIEQIENVIHIHISKETSITLCPHCTHRMLSKGLINRTLNHPILQQPLKVMIHLKQRK